MKKLIVLCVAVLIVILGSGCSDDSVPMEGRVTSEVRVTSAQFIESNNLTVTGSIKVSAGQPLVVMLDSNATTGYSWNEQAKMSDGTVMKQIGHQYVTSQQTGDTPMVGAGGYEEWTFEAMEKGETLLTFRYTRPWETDAEPAWTYALTVTVK